MNRVWLLAQGVRVMGLGAAFFGFLATPEIGGHIVASNGLFAALFMFSFGFYLWFPQSLLLPLSVVSDHEWGRPASRVALRYLVRIAAVTTFYAVCSTMIITVFRGA